MEWGWGSPERWRAEVGNGAAGAGACVAKARPFSFISRTDLVEWRVNDARLAHLAPAGCEGGEEGSIQAGVRDVCVQGTSECDCLPRVAPPSPCRGDSRERQSLNLHLELRRQEWNEENVRLVGVGAVPCNTARHLQHKISSHFPHAFPLLSPLSPLTARPASPSPPGAHSPPVPQPLLSRALPASARPPV